MQNRSVRIFLSSTFRDYGEERDLLVRKVFPNLRAKLKDRFVELVDVDLRWGITVQQAERGEVLPICLAEIDRARPYFVGMLGDRYGWIPPKDAYAPDLVERQPWLNDHRGGKSVTELEMLHGVLNNPKMAGRALFYFRSSSYAKQKGGDYLPESPADHARQQKLKERISQHCFPVVRYRDPEAFAKRLEKDLWKLLDIEFPATGVPDAYAREGLKHEAYAAPRRRLYLGGEKYLTALSAAITKKQSKVLIEGSSGGGKSALLANWLQSYRTKYPKHLLFEYYLGASTDSADPVVLVRRLIETIKRVTGSSEEIAGDPQKLYDSIPTWLATATSYAGKRKTQWILAIDSLNSLNDLRDLRWLPEFLPPNISLIISSLPGEVKEALLTKVSNLPNSSKKEQWHSLLVKPLTSLERKKLLITYLANYNKTLAPDLIKQALAHPLSNNPLFLRTLAEELRLFGVHEELQKRLKHYLTSKTIDDLFERVLKRVEGDNGKEKVQSAMQAIWASRAGLTEKEILAIVKLKPATWAPIRNALDECLLESNGKIAFAHDYMRKAVKDRYLKTKLLEKKAHIGLAKYFQKQPADARRVQEKPYQLREAQEWESLKSCLVGYEFFMKLYEHQGVAELFEHWLTVEEHLSGRMESYLAKRWVIWRQSFNVTEERIASDAVVDLLHYSGRLTNFAVRLARRGLELARNDKAVARTDLINYINLMAVIHKDRGEYFSAEPLYIEALKLSQDLSRNNPESLANRLNNLAVFYRHTGRLDDAEQYYRKSLMISTSIFGSNSKSVAITLSNLTPILRQSGRLKEALECIDCSIAIFKRLYGIEDPGLITILSNRGQVLKSMRRDQDAENTFRFALELSKKLLGRHHTTVALVLRNLANLVQDDDPARAIQFALEALNISRLTLPAIHPDVGTSLEVLGDCLIEEVRLNEAQSLYEEALVIYVKLSLKDDEAGILNKLGLLAHNSGQYDLAEKHYQTALKKLDEIRQSSSRKALTISNNIAMLFKERGELPSALEMSMRVLKLTQKLYPELPVKLAGAIHNVASILEESGSQEEAIRYYKRAIKLLEKSVGKTHFELVDTLVNLGTLMAETGKLQDGKIQLQRARKITEDRFGVNHQRTGIILYHLGGILAEEGKADEALEVLTTEISIAEKVEGENSDSVRLSLRHLGMILRSLGMLAESERYLIRALDVSRTVHGRHSSETASELSALGQLRIEQGRLKEARVFLEDGLSLLNSDPNADPEDIASIQKRLSIALN
ncbi:tetratricopeptide repeat protein [Polynucleobacter rarus]|uniref:tetratricopeptide repeat protein n=1 Tax=Polynucleobacter rarus TaxID=556055 RepID=UPI000D3EC0DA|nr:tetratricopeptide repeat protein [Polynucleobacter rarus]